MIKGPSLSDQPEYQLEAQRARARGSLFRTALVWTPFFAVSLGAWLYFTVGQLFGFGEGWFLVGVLSFVTFLLGYQSVGATRDLFRGTSEVTGRVTRRWARRDSLVIKSHYVRIDHGKIIRLDGVFHTDVAQGDNVRIVYYPSSMMAVTVEKLEQDEETPTNAAT
jgi:hypothetical protein